MSPALGMWPAEARRPYVLQTLGNGCLKETALVQSITALDCGQAPDSNTTQGHEQHQVSGSGVDMRHARISEAVRYLLEALGENPDREGLVKTPDRFAKAMLFFTQGYSQDPPSLLRAAVFNESHKGLVLVKDIDFSSLCEHHLVPFIGKIHVGYIPDGRVVGLSKIARLIEAFARRLQVQERLTTQIAHCMLDVLQPRGVAVVAEGSHQCMVMRGVQKTGATTMTVCMLGVFDEEKDLKDDFWRALNR